MNNYIDLHSHILDNIDDGSRSIEESIEIVRKLNDLGFKEVVATPHYIENSDYNANGVEKRKHLNALKRALKKDGIDSKIYLGNEIFICENLEQLLKDKEISPINNTKYLLIELPFESEIASLDECLFRIRSKGYKVIIAHPERYRLFQENPDKMANWIEMGFLFQCNYGSIRGTYGKHAKKAIKTFLKKGYVSILSSDVHSSDGHFFEDFPKAIKKIRRIVGKEKLEDLTYNNAYKIINKLPFDVE